MSEVLEDKLMGELAGYLAMDKYEQKDYEKVISNAWGMAHDDYIAACEQDKELCDLYDELKRISSIISFDLEDCFQVYSHTINDDDPAYAEDVFVFSPSKLKEAKYLSEHIDEEEKRITSQIEAIQNARLLPFKERKLAKLNKELSLKKEIAEYYNRCMSRQQEKEYYLDNKAKLMDPLVKRFEELTEKYAKKALDKHIKDNPCIVCVRHDSSIYSSNHPRSFPTKQLNKLANALHEKTKGQLKNKSTKGQQQSSSKR